MTAEPASVERLPGLIALLDVHYRGERARAACVAARAWTDAEPAAELTKEVPVAGPYVPGSFYLRELPALTALLAELPAAPAAVVVDGYVWLDEDGRPGLGGHLHRALGGGVPVVGVAKTAFRGAPAVEVLRGRSRRPLYVTSVGLPPDEAAARVASMHGPHRIPTLLKRVDRLSRAGASPGRSTGA